jgi:site-specific recombinase XerD
VSRTVAKEEEARKKAEVIEGRLNPAKTRKSPRFAAFAEEYLEWLRVNRKPLTVKKVTSVLDRLTPVFGAKKLNEITAWDMERYKRERREAGRQPSTINVELVILKAILREALAVRGDAPRVLVTRYGKPWTPEGLTNQFQRASRHAGLERLGPHVLRHTYASRLVMAGVDLRTVQELLGHKDIKQTMRYAHLSPSHKQAAVEALEARFPAKSPINSHNTPPCWHENPASTHS